MIAANPDPVHGDSAVTKEAAQRKLTNFLQMLFANFDKDGDRGIDVKEMPEFYLAMDKFMMEETKRNMPQAEL